MKNKNILDQFQERLIAHAKLQEVESHIAELLEYRKDYAKSVKKSIKENANAIKNLKRVITVNSVVPDYKLKCILKYYSISEFAIVSKEVRVVDLFLSKENSKELCLKGNANWFIDVRYLVEVTI